MRLEVSSRRKNPRPFRFRSVSPGPLPPHPRGRSPDLFPQGQPFSASRRSGRCSGRRTPVLPGMSEHLKEGNRNLDSGGYDGSTANTD